MLAAAPTAFFLFCFLFFFPLMVKVSAHQYCLWGSKMLFAIHYWCVTDMMQCRFILQNICHYRRIQMTLQGDRIGKKKRTKIKEEKNPNKNQGCVAIVCSIVSIPFLFYIIQLKIFVNLPSLLCTISLMSGPILCVW